MEVRNLDTFKKTLQKSEQWLGELGELMDWESDQQAYHGLRVVLHALRDNLPPGEAVHLGAQLPMLLRGLYYEGWAFRAKPKFAKRKEEFLDSIRQHYYNNPDVDLERLACHVFDILSRHVTAGEIQDVVNCLPRDVKALWPKAWQGIET